MDNLELLISLYEIHSPSGGEKRMRKFISKKAFEYGADHAEMDKHGNLFITKGIGDYPCVVAHMDQVQKFHSKDFQCFVCGDTILGYSQSKKRQEGLGADDKNGIFVALECLRKFDNIKLAFFTEEECGTIGSSAADISFFDDCRFVVQCDRKGNSDFVDNIFSMSLCSEEFIHDTEMEKFGYAPHVGGLTDVYALSENYLEVSCCNMSCGYYNPHTDEEVTSISDLERCRDFVFHIIDNCKKKYPHEKWCGENSWQRDWYSYDKDYEYYDEDYENMDAIVSMDYNLTFDEIMEYYGYTFRSDRAVLQEIYLDLQFAYRGQFVK